MRIDSLETGNGLKLSLTLSKAEVLSICPGVSLIFEALRDARRYHLGLEDQSRDTERRLKTNRKTRSIEARRLYREWKRGSPLARLKAESGLLIEDLKLIMAEQKRLEKQRRLEARNREITRLYLGGVVPADIAERFKLSVKSIYRIVSRKYSRLGHRPASMSIAATGSGESPEPSQKILRLPTSSYKPAL